MTAIDVAWLGHSTVVLDVGGVRLLTDPLLGRHAGPLRRRGGERPAEELWEDPDAVLISHLHHDHAELSSLRLLRDVPVLTAPHNAAWLRRKGMTGAVGLVEDTDGTDGEATWSPVAQDVEVRLVRADHGHRPMPHRPNATHGHLVRTPDVRIWVAGDTDLYPEMADLPALAGGPLDLAIVPIGGWGPRLSGGHMDAGRAARACAVSGARRALPVHWGTLHAPFGAHLPRGWMDSPGDHFARELARRAPGCRPVVLRPGESHKIQI
jgi:L-ascorbate metabolism protein UlaG (beta-lactamase superfamily)